MNDKSSLNDIISKLQKKYMKIVEISNLTDELSKVLKSNDSDSIQMIIEMRAREMYDVDVLDREIGKLIYNLDFNQKNVILNDNIVISGDLPDEIVKIRDITSRIKRLLEKIIVVDKNINVKIAGNESYYNK